MTKRRAVPLLVLSRGGLLLVAVSLPLSACGGHDSVSLADVGPKLVDTICTAAVPCQEYPDKATCVATNAANVGQLMADVQSGKAKYDGSAMADCLAELGSQSGLGSCSLTNELTALSSPSCNAAVKGTLATGASCFDSNQCQSANCDNTACTGMTTSCCLGTCVGSSELALGSACTSMDSCVFGAFCQMSAGATTGVCAPRLALGQPCTNLLDCAPGTLCLSSLSGGAQVCAKLPGRGESCAAGGACDAFDDYCSSTGTCTARVAPGGACPTGIECVAYATCDAATTTCVTKGTEGAACSAANCLGSLACTNAVCTAPAPPPVCS